MGQALLAKGNAADATGILEQALRSQEASEKDAVYVAETRFALARALLVTGEDRARARRLAELAFEPFRAAGDLRKKDFEAVKTWLAAPEWKERTTKVQ
jgi:hypothetical protein